MNTEAQDHPRLPWIELDQLKAEYRAAGSGDVYGDCMGWWFAIAAELDLRGEDVPEAWHYRPGAGGSIREGYEAGICEEATTEALFALGALLARLYDICKARGWDY